ncbi:endonuclease III [Sulfodiicoccus acidiphilus]|uniref:Endonuclease III n=1 Tax=Sulfodiicoccus acidiphilus TaxID=1670455 RepID=A0A348B6V4_9CREN|nr:endonuclease III [Sulfodiicoccus acidiphilus]BBD73906.1 endonuclease III [Sulfodiicoccus acidiphilus]GGT95960.1 endonuclease III [Sulfodiicoccus acidiphilus]
MVCDSSALMRLLHYYNLEPKDFISLKVWLESRDPFKVLVATILSQNSTDKSAFRAYYSLELKVGVTPSKIYEASLGLLEEALRVAGLHRLKSVRLKEISKIVLDKYGGDLNVVLNYPPERAREELTSMPGVGEKTADVVLLTCRGYPFFPVDTHIRRISIRLGMVGENPTYTAISKALSSLVIENEYLRLHLVLIQHGRNICKAGKPLCDRCPLSNCCDYARAQVGESKTSSTPRGRRSRSVRQSGEGGIGL